MTDRYTIIMSPYSHGLWYIAFDGKLYAGPSDNFKRLADEVANLNRIQQEEDRAEFIEW